jgi:hypothetical protein
MRDRAGDVGDRASNGGTCQTHSDIYKEYNLATN